MNNSIKKDVYTLAVLVTLLLGIVVVATPYRAEAYNYGQSYYQGYYYSQGYYYTEGSYYSEGSYYAQGSYQTNFTTNVTTSGNFNVVGTISKGSGTFVIDHPLDPQNKLLFHSFVESPDVKNIYDGVVTLNAQGEATIELPSYFEALNKDFRYQIKPITKSSPNLYVKEEIQNNTFTIAGGPADTRISWQVTGIRKDPYIIANPIIVEVEKGPDTLVDKGEYLFSGYEKKSLLITIKNSIAGFFSAIIGFFFR